MVELNEMTLQATSLIEIVKPSTNPKPEIVYRKSVSVDDKSPEDVGAGETDKFEIIVIGTNPLTKLN